MLLIIFLCLYFVALCYLSSRKTLADNFFPDEGRRLKLPMFFFEHGYLPTGYEESVRMEDWGFSYANYPLMLSTLVGGVFMKIVGCFTSDPDRIILGARMVSILSAVGFAFFALKAAGLAFRKPFGYLFAGLILFLPQFVFLGLYFNNDMLALFGSSMIFYAWVSAYRNKWGWGNALLMAIGISVVALAYYNAYSWILLSILVYFLIWYRQSAGFSFVKTRFFYQITALVIVVVLLIAGSFFVRTAVINHGDVFGFSTVSMMRERYGSENFRPGVRPTPQKSGLSMLDMVFHGYYGADEGWLASTCRSFVGVLGTMTVRLPIFVYAFYALVIGVGCIAYVGAVIHKTFAGARDRESWIIDGVMLINIVIVVMLALRYSYSTDYQPQGRYIMPMILSLMYFVVCGWDRVCTTVCKLSREAQYGVAGLLIGASAATLLASFSIAL